MTDAYLNRRTFAIISHPDAGKTTLTEKLLYFSGAIRLAGVVKARGDRRRARSLLDGGYRYVRFNRQEFELYAGNYFRPRVTDAEWNRFTELMRSPRLRPRYSEQGVIVFEVMKRTDAE